jgi:hypothetical protein
MPVNAGGQYLLKPTNLVLQNRVLIAKGRVTMTMAALILNRFNAVCSAVFEYLTADPPRKGAKKDAQNRWCRR